MEFAFGSSAPLIAISTAEASDSSSSSAVSSVMLARVRSSDLCGVSGVALSPRSFGRRGCRIHLFFRAPELVDGPARIGGAIELERDGCVQRVCLAVRRARASASGWRTAKRPAGVRTPSRPGWRGARAARRRSPRPSRTIRRLAAVPALERTFGHHGQGRDVARGRRRRRRFLVGRVGSPHRPPACWCTGAG